MGIGATRTGASEGYNRTWPARLTTSEEAGRKAVEIWGRLTKGR